MSDTITISLTRDQVAMLQELLHDYSLNNAGHRHRQAQVAFAWRLQTKLAQAKS